MSRHVPNDRLEAAHIRLSSLLRKQSKPQWLRVGSETIIEGHDLIALLDELRRRRQSFGRKGAFRLSNTTKVLMALAVGETVEVEPITQGALTNARSTARKHLELPDAVWQSRVQPNGLVQITRMPNGSPFNAKTHNPAVYVMASMAIGQTVTLTTLKGKMHNGIKSQARKLMDATEPQWRCTNLTNGDVRCQRTR